MRGSVIFATMYVYGPSGAPMFYTATLQPTALSLQWSGDLYATTGDWFGTVPYNPADIAYTQVGTMTWSAPYVEGPNTLTYTVNGVTVVKNMTRLTLVNQNYSGHFAGGIHETDAACSNPADDGTFENIGVLNVSQSGTAVTMTATSNRGSCTYAGTLTQYGQMGYVPGTFSCSTGTNGTFTIFEFQSTLYGISGRFTAMYNGSGCGANGWFSGMTVTTF